MAISIALDDRLETAMFVYPFKAGWVDASGVEVVERLTPGRVDGADLALIDSVAALTMLDSHVIIRDAAVVSRTASMLTLTTHTRPDDVDSVTVVIEDISPAGRAVVTAVLERFYGITARDWAEEKQAVSESTAVVTEGAEALIAADNEDFYQEDLGRAWFLMTDKPFVSHVCVAPRGLLASDPSTVAGVVERLATAREMGQERGRELRRDLSKDLGIDRETLVDVLADQTHTLDDDALEGLAELAGRVGLSVGRNQLRSAAVNVSR